MAIKYSLSQQVAIQTVNDWIANPNRPKHCILKAGAGRGKTFMLANMFDTSQPHHVDIKQSPFLFVTQTATTHVAIDQVVSNVIDKQKTPVIETLHSALGLSPSTNTYFKEQRNPKEFAKSSYLFSSRAQNYSKSLFIVDEAYRIDSELYSIMTYLHPNAYWLFLGDPFQTPPVGEDVAYIECIDPADKVEYELMHPMRFKDDDLADTVENLLLATKYMETKWEEVLPSKDVDNAACWKNAAFMKGEVDRRLLYPIPTNEFAIVCGTRKKADYFNSYIFNQRAALNLPTIHSNEIPIQEYSFNFKKEGNKVVDKAEILAKFRSNPMAPDKDKKILKLGTLETGSTHLILIGDEGKGLSGKALSVLHGLCRIYNNMVYIFRTNIAKTVHTAQGITSEVVFVDMPSIYRWFEVDMRRRLTYTAASRASKQLYFVE